MVLGQEKIKKETNEDISAFCPICNDHKPRLHLYEKDGTLLVHCFRGRCGHHSNLWNFIKAVKPDLLDSYKRESFGEVMKSLSSQNEKPKEKTSEVSIVTVPLEPLLSPLEWNSEAVNYLNKRSISYNEESFGKWYYGTQDLEIDGTLYNIKDSIVIPLYYEEKIYGFYSRSINKKSFVTYNHPSNIGYKVWNWFNIKKDEPVYIFEGIFDAISSGKKNIIALMGAKIPDERLKELRYPVFCLDNDKAGWQNSIHYATLGYNVYIQPDNVIEKDMNEILKNHPEINISSLINDNVYTGLSAAIRLKTRN